MQSRIGQAAIGAFALAAGFAVASGQNIVNGSMSGSPAANNVPVDWAIEAFTPDTIGPGGLSGAGFGFAPQIAASPDGTTFIGLQAELANVGASPVAESFAESVSTMVTDLVVGEMYDISFYQVNAQYVTGNQVRFDPGAFDVEFGGVVQRSPSTGAFQGQGNQVWQLITLTFVANAVEEKLTFTAVDLPGVDNQFANFGGVGLGLDGVSIELSADEIPAPATLTLLGMGGLAAARRRRA